MIDIVLPDDAWTDVEAGTEGLLDEWLVAPGDAVEAGQVIANVMLVKAAHELLAPAAGIIESLDVAAAQNFGKGVVLAKLRPQ